MGMIPPRTRPGLYLPSCSMDAARMRGPMDVAMSNDGDVLSADGAEVDCAEVSGPGDVYEGAPESAGKPETDDYQHAP